MAASDHRNVVSLWRALIYRRRASRILSPFLLQMQRRGLVERVKGTRGIYRITAPFAQTFGTDEYDVLFEISANEAIGASVPVRIDEVLPPLRVSSIEDIIAEKLRALLQQPIRNRQRRQDVLDIAVLLRLHSEIDRSSVSRFLVLKCEARDIDARKSSFLHPEIRRRAQIDYDALEATTRVLFIPFDEAWELLLSFVNELQIPD